MREIKFRYWDIDTKKMVHNFMLYSDGKLCMFEYNHTVEILNKGNYPLMQYVGEVDKNGKSIYEGDIIEYKDWRSKNKIVRDVVSSLSFTCYWLKHSIYDCSGGDYSLMPEDCIVIGNIYENPELIEI